MPNLPNDGAFKTAGVCLYVAVSCFSTPASAQSAPFTEQASGVEFELGGGAYVTPSFEGSDHYTAGAYPSIRFGYLALENGFLFGGGDDHGLSFRPSFRYLSKRAAGDDTALIGLDDVNPAIELGAGLRYGFGQFSVSGDLRYGVTGHNGFVAELGADYTLKPVDQITLMVGPRASLASSNYMETNFGVSPSEATAFGSSAFEAQGGFKSIGFEVSLRYQIDDNWALESGAGYDRLINDAANSPITAVGSKDQFTFKLGLVRKIRIDF